MSDHEIETDDVPWMCEDVESRVRFGQRQTAAFVVVAMVSGFCFSLGVFGVLFGFVFALVALGMVRTEIEDVAHDSAWDQRCHDSEVMW